MSSREMNATTTVEADKTENNDKEERCTSGGTIFLRLLLLVTSTSAILCSVYTATSCRFIMFESEPELASSFPSELQEMSISSIGMFQYATTEVIGSTTPSFWDFSTCQPYEEYFWMAGFSPFVWTAQLAAIIAPAIGGLAMTLHLLELICCQLCFVLPTVLFLLASLVQAYTFVIYGEADMCLGGDGNDCRLSHGGFVSVAAIVLYYFCTVIMCFLPRSEPCLGWGKGSKSEEAEAALQDAQDEEFPSEPPTITTPPPPEADSKAGEKSTITGTATSPTNVPLQPSATEP